jgi:putative ABC transport system substrate-binding protein
MKRREFISLIGGAAVAWPLAARAQQSATPVIGYLNLGSPESDASRMTGLGRGLNQSGYAITLKMEQLSHQRWQSIRLVSRPAIFARLIHLQKACGSAT